MRQRFDCEDFDVFARVQRGDPLVHIGTVRAPSGRLAAAYANWVYDEEDWAELCVVPRNCVFWVKELGDPYDKQRGA
ncbi:MAG TPA: hypothetical protein VIK75_07170 [Calditerricola sp.]|uniref:hypothetical protein n=1 Tax=Calditerricola satsumensis TaxID=373054 RepID=UPI0006D2C0F3|nr:hypothetical protein [Calditerricola satsumensis]